jgi:hypothetical protein
VVAAAVAGGLIFVGGGMKEYKREEIYKTGIDIVAIVTFFSCWIYCVATYGFLLGVGLGWLPSLIVAVIAGFLWPFILLAIGLLIFVAGILFLLH